MSHDDFDFEPVRGLPATLPAGEKLLWQGEPDWKSLAIHAYHVRKVGLYFLLLMAWRVWVGVSEGHAPSAIALSCLILLGLGLAAAGVLSLLAYLAARATVYSITSRRVLLRHGVAVPMTLNLPFAQIDNAALKRLPKGLGDLSLAVPRDQRVGYIITWPHVRPSHLGRPQPSLRSVADADTVAAILSAALAADAGTRPLGLHARDDGRVPGPAAAAGAGPRAAVA
jgi:hypothetical protein